MPTLSKSSLSGLCKRSRKSTIALFVLLAICLFGRVAEAEYGDGNDVIAFAETSTYAFLSNQSKLVKTGGFAGVHETYPIEGQFQLSIDFDAGKAWFGQVDANLIDDSGLLYERGLGVIFNMAELLGTVVDDTTIDFVGKTADGMESTILLTLTFRDDSVHLASRTVPPPNSADFFIYELDAAASKKYGGGTGEPNDPYLIYTAEQMNAIGAEPNDWDKHFKLMANIDLSVYAGTDFNIIGYWVDWGSSDNKPFAGVFDGNGQIISNFNYTSTDANNIGLFAYVDYPNAEIKDLGLIDPNVEAETGWVFGSLVGHMRTGTISGCYVKGGSVSGNSAVGGLVGWNGGIITNCRASSEVSGRENSAGALVGINLGIISNCHSSGSVSGKEIVGGMVGYNSDTIIDSYAIGNVTGGGTLGGLVGSNEGTISSCHSTGSVSGNRAIGGLVGQNGGTYSGREVLFVPGGIENCYSTGSVTGMTTVGGLVGYNDVGTITYCYSAGNVTGATDVGGMIGDKDESVEPECTSSFWDIETSGLTNSAGGTGKTTAEMQTESTFTDADWDFVGESENGTEDFWSICDGTNYPRLAWQIAAGDFVCPDGITIDDFLFFIEHWRYDNCDPSNDYCQGTDLDFSGTVDKADLEIFLENWLADVRSD
ncbi:MAG TPA: GLUG motif-containing protein [Sedimentisphaerales bacterium]|nr:GLUG motif-containing protein [Sedimentisphaerales bacterium]